MKDKPFKLYLLVDDCAIGSPLIQEFEEKCVQFIMPAESFLMQRPGILQLKNFVYGYISLVQSLDIMYYRQSASS